MASAACRLVFYAFDLLHLGGWDVSGLQLFERKELLEPLVANKPGLQFNGHDTGDGEVILKHAGKLGFEGVVSKTIDAPYAPGNRGLWRKAKALNRQEFVVVGWSDPEGSRPHLGALLLGYYTDDGKLIYAGRVGTGMPEGARRSAATAGSAGPEDVASERPAAAHNPLRIAARALTRPLGRPKLVAEITYLTWTADDLFDTPSMSACVKTSRRSKFGERVSNDCGSHSFDLRARAAVTARATWLRMSRRSRSL